MASNKQYMDASKGNEKYPYPSVYGSHETMVDKEATKFLSNENGHLVVCRDADGFYLTEKKNLDSKLADPYRCASPEWRAEFMKKHVTQEDDGALIDVDEVTGIERDYEQPGQIRLSFRDGTKRLYVGERAQFILGDLGKKPIPSADIPKFESSVTANATVIKAQP